MELVLLLYASLSTVAAQGARYINEEEHLITNLFQGYEKSVRPAIKQSDMVDVQIKMTLTNLISLKQQDESLTSNVWIELQWIDKRLSWDSKNYDGVDLIRVPPNMVWLPDIVLENNVDGQFEIAVYCNVLIYSTGGMYWLPPAIYRSACPIAVTFFPFDWQNCTLVFRSQTYSAKEINMELTIENKTTIEWIEIDPEAFTENGEWAIRHRPAKKVINKLFSADDLEYQEVVFYLIIQRKPLFYVINIIVPCVLISSLSLMVFFLPAQAGGQKCTLSISVLLAQTVFLFLIAQKVPQTSLNVPLIAKTQSTHRMSARIRQIFIDFLPPLLRLVQDTENEETTSQTEDGTMPRRRRSSLRLMAKAEEYMMKTPRSELMFERQRHRKDLMSSTHPGNRLENGGYHSLSQASAEVKASVAACKYISECRREKNDFDSVSDDWIMMGKVIDRICFCVMSVLILLGTLSIFFMGHLNQAPALPFPGDPKKYLPE
uniref:acetylcholine receptor subunit gamma-like isoform X2 n=1 Tax=Myxine glutinosa TaxID=7769 RepID=UPI00359008CF